MPCREAVYDESGLQVGTFVPVKFYKLRFVVTPIFKMFAYAKRTNDFSHPIAQFFYGVIVEMVPMVVADYQIVNILGHVAWFVYVGAGEWLVDECNRGCFVKNRVDKKSTA